MAYSFIPFDGWSPGGGYFGEGWEVATNLYPFFGSWRPWRTFAGLPSSVADGPMTGRHVHKWAAAVAASGYVPDAQTIFTGSQTKLYSVNPSSGAFTDLSRTVGGAYGTGGGSGGWRFADVGNDTWVANWVDVLQRRTNNTGNFADGVVSAFVPKPRFICSVREHLVAANLSNAGRFQDEVVWSDADNATNFDPPTGTSISIAGNKRLTEIPGQITGLIGMRAGAMVFKREGVYFLYCTGSVQVFQPDLLSSSVGTAFPSSIINSRHGVFFLGPDGFYQISGISSPMKISPPGVDELLLNSQFSNLSTVGSLPGWREDGQAVGFQSPSMPLIGWAFRGLWSAAGNDQALLYSPTTQQWALCDVANGAALVNAVVERPYSSNLYESLAALTWDGSVSRLAPLSNQSADTRSATLKLRFRPANFAEASLHGQSKLRAVLPVFSKINLSDTALTPSVTVEPMLDPFLTAYGATEDALPGTRDAIAGHYPIQRAGRWFRISIITSEGEDFAHFPGAWVDQELLT